MKMKAFIADVEQKSVGQSMLNAVKATHSVKKSINQPINQSNKQTTKQRISQS